MPLDGNGDGLLDGVVLPTQGAGEGALGHQFALVDGELRDLVCAFDLGAAGGLPGDVPDLIDGFFLGAASAVWVPVTPTNSRVAKVSSMARTFIDDLRRAGDGAVDMSIPFGDRGDWSDFSDEKTPPKTAWVGSHDARLRTRRVPRERDAFAREGSPMELRQPDIPPSETSSVPRHGVRTECDDYRSAQLGG